MAIVQRQTYSGVYQQDRDPKSAEVSPEGFEFASPGVVVDPDREALLSHVIVRTVIPSLLLQNKSLVLPFEDRVHPDETHIKKLSALILGPDNADAIDYIILLRDRGISLDILHLELLEPTARYLGELWNRDEIDFIAVTVGVGRLQRIVHHFADLDKVGAYDEKRRALIMAAPGEDHSFGTQIVQKFMRAAGWSILSLAGKESNRVIDIVSSEWFAVIGFSISGQTYVDELSETIRTIRSTSLNRRIGIMIGGPLVLENPELVGQLGADGTAANAASAVVLAKKLLALGLQSEVE